MELAMNGGLCLLFWLYHFVEKWADHRRDISKVGLFDWVKEFPAQSATSTLATVGAFAGCYVLDWMNPGMAMACGYAGDSITRRIVGKFTT